jgi:hypothetical protein
MTYASIRTARKSKQWKTRQANARHAEHAALVKHGALNATAVLRSMGCSEGE